MNKSPKIITFYSYKGGVGRSMALANVAWILAEKFKVIAIDWDLEAPGLHNYFNISEENVKNGLIDLFYDYKDLLRKEELPKNEDFLDIDKYLEKVSGNFDSSSLFLLAAGKFDDDYAKKVNAFDWENFYKNWYGYRFIEYLKEKLGEKADFILVDSRTGITDIGGICTVQMPNLVFLFFSFNRQNILGIKKIFEEIRKSAKLMGKKSPKLILIPSRVEKYLENNLLNDWADIASQELVEYLVDGQKEETFREYVEKNLIPYSGYYSFGEKIVNENDVNQDLINSYKNLETLILKELDYEILDKLLKYDVFICHSSKDKPIIRALIEDLKKEQIAYWIDAEQIEFGDSITEKIYEGLTKSKFILLCISKNLITSDWTRAEYGAILNTEFSGNSDRKVIPLLLKDCDLDDIPSLLRDKKLVNYSDKIDFYRFIDFIKKNQSNYPTLKPPFFPNEISNIQTDNTNIPETFTSSSIDMDFVLIPAGEFMMGSPFGELSRKENEGPFHYVSLKNSFYIGKYPVTQKQWKKVIQSNPSYFEGEDLPVDSISWSDAQSFIQKLNEKEGTNKYRLPSEAEWEYACRASTYTRFSFGDDDLTLNEYGWYNKNSKGKTYPIGQKKPNLWGLYDMHGNVWEWVQDVSHYNYNNAPTDGSVWESGNSNTRIVRGGSKSSSSGECRSAKRFIFQSDYSDNSSGFRLVKDV